MILIFDPANDRNIQWVIEKLDSSQFQKRDYKEISKVALKVEVKDISQVQAVIYHAGGSGGVSVEQAGINIDELLSFRSEKDSFIYLSDGPNYRDIGKKDKALKIVDTSSNFKEDIKKIIEYESISCYDAILRYCKKKAEIISFSLLLHLFLPLDIDMQALEMIQGDSEKVKKYLWGDKDVEGMFQSRKGDEHYRQKLYDLWYLIGEKPPEDNKWKPSEEAKKLTPINNPDHNLRKLTGLDNGRTEESQIYKFFKFLDTCKKNDKNVTAASLSKPFKDWKINDREINSFHNWYSELASCFKGGDAA